MTTTTAHVVAVVYLAIGGVFAYSMAISTRAIVVLMILWPVFLLLIIVGQVVNLIQGKSS